MTHISKHSFQDTPPKTDISIHMLQDTFQDTQTRFKTHISNTQIKTHNSRLVFQDTRFKTHISRHMFQDTCFKTYISRHTFQDTHFKAHTFQDTHFKTPVSRHIIENTHFKTHTTMEPNPRFRNCFTFHAQVCLENHEVRSQLPHNALRDMSWLEMLTYVSDLQSGVMTCLPLPTTILISGADGQLLLQYRDASLQDELV